MSEIRIAVIGLGYVGLPLACEFGKKNKTIGYDINSERVLEINNFYDSTNELSSDKIQLSLESKLIVTSDENLLSEANYFIITVPTPVDVSKKPNLKPIIKATELVSKYIKNGDIIVYESTVYPGCTEEVCVPIIEQISGYKLNNQFYVGYSPERINPGDKKHTLVSIKKVISGSSKICLDKLEKLYSSIITAGLFKASTIKVAEAAKVIENAQRDINIAFINELAILFNIMGIDTTEVLEAANTKWNFLNFKPGLVGGHCIGVDPYYLSYKAQSIGYNPEIILAGRRINDYMSKFIANEIIKLCASSKLDTNNISILILGATFKENCPDYRNTKVVDLYKELDDLTNGTIEIYDPHIESEKFNKEYNIQILKNFPKKTYDLLILAVSHNEFKDLDLNKMTNKNSVIYDIKSFYNKNLVSKRL